MDTGQVEKKTTISTTETAKPHEVYLDGYFRELYKRITQNQISEDDFTKLMKEERLRLERNAETDPLTGAFNRGHIDDRIRSEIEESRENKLGVGVIFIDLDKFKEVNDTYGHKTGDRVLQSTTKVIKEALGKSGSFGRWGGEEFVAVVTNCTLERLEEICCQIGTLTRLGVGFEAGMPKLQTMSIGATMWNGQETADELIARADKLMYLSKAKATDQERNKLTIQTGIDQPRQIAFDEAVEIGVKSSN